MDKSKPKIPMEIEDYIAKSLVFISDPELFDPEVWEKTRKHLINVGGYLLEKYEGTTDSNVK